jgi:hypothetical protein
VQPVHASKGSVFHSDRLVLINRLDFSQPRFIVKTDTLGALLFKPETSFPATESSPDAQSQESSLF